MVQETRRRRWRWWCHLFTYLSWFRIPFLAKVDGTIYSVQKVNKPGNHCCLLGDMLTGQVQVPFHSIADISAHSSKLKWLISRRYLFVTKWYDHSTLLLVLSGMNDVIRSTRLNMGYTPSQCTIIAFNKNVLSVIIAVVVSSNLLLLDCPWWTRRHDSDTPKRSLSLWPVVSLDFKESAHTFSGMTLTN